MSNEVKVVVVGDGAVGKTCMIICYIKDEFPTGYTPTVFDAHKGNMDFDGREVALHVWDTAGQEDLARLRPLAYPNANCFLVCFSLVDRESLNNACTQWRNELLTLGPVNCPRILVGLKSDLREQFMQSGDPDKVKQCVSTEEGKAKKDEYTFQHYLECSAMTRDKLPNVFYRAVQTHFAVMKMQKEKGENQQPGGGFDKPEKPPKKSGGCSLL